MATTTATATANDARTRLLDAAVEVVRRKGLNATTVDDLCRTAGVTKGAFFHHFASKEAFAVAAAGHWAVTTSAMFADADYHDLDDPLDRILGYLDLRASLIVGGPAEYSCLVGTMTQEIFESNPDIRAACAASMLGHADTLVDDLRAALDRVGSNLDADDLARYTQVVLQGAFVVGKATDEPGVVLDSIAHLRRYLVAVLAPD
jgi:TetR/AcrR family transcriptional regulator, transcriptional repressor for nem operon